jgi:preprotein translocase subunit YajC
MEDYLFLALAGAMIVFMVLSSRKRKAQAAEMATKVLPGAKVMLTSGIYGDVVSVDSDRITIKSAGNSTLEVAKGAVARVVEAAPEKKSSAVKKPAAKSVSTKK